MSTELTSMTDMNISGFITYNRTTSTELRQSVGTRVTNMTVPEQCVGGSSNKGILCGCLRWMRGWKTDGVQRPRAITPGDHVPGSKILHR
jgi:hypothetical protein